MAGEWKPDPRFKHELRYHDGKKWTDHVSDQGVASVDPMEVLQPTHVAVVDDEVEAGDPTEGRDPSVIAALPAPQVIHHAAAPASVADEIRKLGELRDAGLLTDAEFDAQKAKLLG